MTGLNMPYSEVSINFGGSIVPRTLYRSSINFGGSTIIHTTIAYFIKNFNFTAQNLYSIVVAKA